MIEVNAACLQNLVANVKIQNEENVGGVYDEIYDSFYLYCSSYSKGLIQREILSLIDLKNV